MSDIKTVKNEGETIPFFPDHVITEAKVVLGIMVLVIIVGIIAAFVPVGVEEPADPLNTPAHVKPEWYFLAMYQYLKFVPETFGVVTILLAFAILAFWPFIDRKKETTTKSVKIRFILTAIALIALIGMTIWGGM